MIFVGLHFETWFWECDMVWAELFRNIFNAPLAMGVSSSPGYHIYCKTFVIKLVAKSNVSNHPICVSMGCLPPSVLFFRAVDSDPFRTAV